MSKVVFILNGKDITIQCKNQQTMKEICQNYGTKVQINIEKYLFLYNGNQINMEKTFEKQANAIDIKRNQMNVLVSEIKGEEKRKKDKIKDDLIQKGKEILKIHLDGRSYKEPKVNDWILNIINDFEQYFYQKYSSYHLFTFCFVCSKNTQYYSDSLSILLVDEEDSNCSVFNSNDLHSVLRFFFFTNFTSNPCPLLEPKVISTGNKLLYEIFDERKYGEIMIECCKKLNGGVNKIILELDRRRRCLNTTLAFKKPFKDFSYNFKIKSSYDLVRIIQTFITPEVEIWHFLFIISNDK